MDTFELIKQIDENAISFEDFACLSEQGDLIDFVNSFSLNIAKLYMKNEIEFELADGAMNYIFGFMTDDIFMNFSSNYIPSPAIDIYDAFDAGEYQHSGDSDDTCPIEKYTKPHLIEVLETYGSLRVMSEVTS
ncbi:hypothetical protein [Pseudoalteromonas aurantia]|uniref:Uncharacterized protein n=1 Tax=Pseudoalteromonas aurantia TaxID=43654 RepID=A0A5S3UY65_9GAMM|nr:hypothetical protein [Pseudoalteromonas aurantia]TMO62501.1 hypothetical protein CWC19_20270 [Pseudoalteromonas aurantia]TMO62528.1 hypothetical protein CWC18_09910 [Pseudoalteromonas aurantia]TMO76396.1 hypothetical protein CWC20_05730 [Pseudoalteromonas aurantia]